MFSGSPGLVKTRKSNEVERAQTAEKEATHVTR